MTDTLLMMIALAVAGVALWVWARRSRPREVLPPAPEPLQPEDDPVPSTASMDSVDERVEQTDRDLERYDARPTLPNDFTLGGPDDRAVDLLRTGTGRPDG